MKLLLNENNNSNMVLDEILKFCDVFNLELVSCDYNEYYNVGYDYYVTTLSEPNSPYGYGYNPIYYVRISDEGKIFICEEDKDDAMEIEEYKEYLIDEFEKDGWVYENGSWK